MSTNKKMAEKQVCSPKGKAYFVKVNTVIDDNNGKKNYQLSLKFDAETEAKFKAYCDELLEKAKAAPEFKGAKWLATPYMPYKEDEKNGGLFFKFHTMAYTTDRNTGETVRRYIPVFDTKKRIRLGNDVTIGYGSTVRVMFTPTVYFTNARVNGLNFYLDKITVDDMVAFGGSENDASGFGFTLAENDGADDFGNLNDEEIPF